MTKVKNYENIELTEKLSKLKCMKEIETKYIPSFKYI